jgi:MarR family 2-MHQ and catechol resistance regulon transcriptional repressor
LAGKYDLSQQQWTLLGVLYRAGQGMTMTELGKNLLVTKANMTGMIDRLERDGYVTRHPDQFDRRVTKVMLTDKGTTFMQEIEAPRDEFTAEMLSSFSDQDVDQLSDYMDRIFNQLNR